MAPEGPSGRQHTGRPAGDFAGVTTGRTRQEGRTQPRPQRAELPPRARGRKLSGRPVYGEAHLRCPPRHPAAPCAWARVLPAGRVHAGASPAPLERRRRTCEVRGAEVGVRSAPHVPQVTAHWSRPRRGRSQHGLHCAAAGRGSRCRRRWAQCAPRAAGGRGRGARALPAVRFRAGARPAQPERLRSTRREAHQERPTRHAAYGPPGW